MDNFIREATNDVQVFFAQPNAYRSVLIFIAAIAIAYFASKYLAKIIIVIAQKVALHSESVSDDIKAIRLRQVETYLSVAVAVIRVAVVAVVAYVVWRLVSPVSSSGVAAIGASAFFIVFAGQTLGMVLRDITAGVIMITEQWFNVGDYIKVEPFLDVTGVVERFTLRSTKLRTLRGEVVWIHNQQIQAVHVTPKGVRTITVDLFTRDIEAAEAELKEIISTLPTGASLMPKPLRIQKPEQWGNDMWRISVMGQTAPGREWLVEDFFVNAVKEVDEDKRKKADKIFTYDPIARHTDAVAERRFKRAVRVQKND